MGLRERFQQYKEERDKRKGEERAFKESEEDFLRQQRAGEINIEALSPSEERAKETSETKTRESAVEAIRKARAEQFEAAPETLRRATEARSASKAAEEEAMIIETELYGAPHVNPQEITRDKFGREIHKEPLTGKRRLEAAKSQRALMQRTEIAQELAVEGAKEIQSEFHKVRRKKKQERVTGPLSGIIGAAAKGTIGAVEGIGRGVGGIRVSGSAHVPQRPVSPVSPGMKSGVPQIPLWGPPQGESSQGSKIPLFGASQAKPSQGPKIPLWGKPQGGPTQGPKISLFGSPQGSPTQGPKIPLFPTGRPANSELPQLSLLPKKKKSKPGSKGRKSNYGDQMRRIRKMLI